MAVDEVRELIQRVSCSVCGTEYDGFLTTIDSFRYLEFTQVANTPAKPQVDLRKYRCRGCPGLSFRLSILRSK